MIVSSCLIYIKRISWSVVVSRAGRRAAVKHRIRAELRLVVGITARVGVPEGEVLDDVIPSHIDAGGDDRAILVVREQVVLDQNVVRARPTVVGLRGTRGPNHNRVAIKGWPSRVDVVNGVVDDNTVLSRPSELKGVSRAAGVVVVVDHVVGDHEPVDSADVHGVVMAASSGVVGPVEEGRVPDLKIGCLRA